MGRLHRINTYTSWRRLVHFLHTKKRRNLVSTPSFYFRFWPYPKAGINIPSELCQRSRRRSLSQRCAFRIESRCDQLCNGKPWWEEGSPSYRRDKDSALRRARLRSQPEMPWLKQKAVQGTTNSKGCKKQQAVKLLALDKGTCDFASFNHVLTDSVGVLKSFTSVALLLRLNVLDECRIHFYIL